MPCEGSIIIDGLCYWQVKFQLEILSFGGLEHTYCYCFAVVKVASETSVIYRSARKAILASKTIFEELKHKVQIECVVRMAKSMPVY